MTEKNQKKVFVCFGSGKTLLETKRAKTKARVWDRVVEIKISPDTLEAIEYIKKASTPTERKLIFEDIPSMVEKMSEESNRVDHSVSAYEMVFVKTKASVEAFLITDCDPLIAFCLESSYAIAGKCYEVVDMDYVGIPNSIGEKVMEEVINLEFGLNLLNKKDASLFNELYLTVVQEIPTIVYRAIKGFQDAET